MTIKIIPNERSSTPEKLADVELHFDSSDGALDGLKLLGFMIWQRRSGSGYNVTFPARAYTVNGERRSFALLRPIADTKGQDRIRDLILQAWQEYQDAAMPQPRAQTPEQPKQPAIGALP